MYGVPKDTRATCVTTTLGFGGFDYHQFDVPLTSHRGVYKIVFACSPDWTFYLELRQRWSYKSQDLICPGGAFAIFAGFSIIGGMWCSPLRFVAL